MSIVSRYIDNINVCAFKHTGKMPIGSFNMVDEVNPVITTNASVRQVSRSKNVSSVPNKVYDEKYVPLSFMTADDTPKWYASEAVVNKLANGAEIDNNTPRPRSKDIMALYDKILNGGGVTAFNGVMMTFPNSGSMTR